MKKIGILYGSEVSFPHAVLEAVNSKKKDVKAEFINIDVFTIKDALKYNVIFDRVSNKVEFYRSILKAAALAGVKVLNDPFSACADDNFYNAALATKLKINTPKTLILPSKEHPEDTNSSTFRNLAYPLDWKKAFKYIGFPAILKPNRGETSYNEYKVYNEHEFFSAYELSGRHCMVLQEYIDHDEYFRCYTIGMRDVMITHYDPGRPMHKRFSIDRPVLGKKLENKVKQMCIDICTALRFEFNAVEIAVKNGRPYAVEFLNSTPNADEEYLHEENFMLLVDRVSDYLIETAIAQ